ncbi:helix-turn-helix transcriptional regulator [Streptomyces sp. NPDC057939]|uniref:helix-turn-helix transcriptional regulator n=1 Tax=Streptomyces sp. NPDC057939 TaxID=3346284 RepID=UPI0036F17A3E
MPERGSDSQQRRDELAAFLRSRRARITPQEVGLPLTGRRRTPGLRREELALLAGMSATWYTYLEQGRHIRASDQVLDALAGVLRLDAHERDHLFRLAGRAPSVEGPEPLDPEVAAVPLLLQPHPAYVIDETYEVLSHNPATERVFPGLVTSNGRAPNLARWTFLDPRAREVLIDWEEEARGLLARVRTLAGSRPGDTRHGRLVDELHEGSSEVREWWPRFEVQARGGGRKRLRSADGGVATYAYTAFHVAGRPGQTLVIYAA